MFIGELNFNTIRLQDKPIYNKFTELLVHIDLDKEIEKYSLRELDYSIKVSSVYSSNIEGNPIDINSYMRIENSKSQEFKRDKSIQEINDLKEAYEFAMNNELNEKNFLNIHSLISKELKISSSEKGAYRIGEEEVIYDESGIRYIAIETKYVNESMREFFEDITTLLQQHLTIEESFYYSILIHLIFVNIHPFRDGNGRCARLLQKWFLSYFLKEVSWKIPFESYLAKNLEKYYNTIHLGPTFYDLEYNNSLPFFEFFIGLFRK